MIEWPAFTRSFCGGVDLKDDISEKLNMEMIFDQSILLKFIGLLDIITDKLIRNLLYHTNYHQLNPFLR